MPFFGLVGRAEVADLVAAEVVPGGVAASLAFQEGASTKEVQAMLRHTRQATTSDLYIHVFEEVRRGTADRMDTVLRKLGGM